jgi:hypothetical protein
LASVVNVLRAAENRALELGGNGSYTGLPPGIFKDLEEATMVAAPRVSAG